MSKLRKTLAILLVLVMSLSLLAGCGNKSGDGKKDDGTSNENRTLNIAASGDTGTLYPLALSGGFVSLQYAFYEFPVDIHKRRYPRMETCHLLRAGG